MFRSHSSSSMTPVRRPTQKKYITGSDCGLRGLSPIGSHRVLASSPNVSCAGLWWRTNHRRIPNSAVAWLPTKENRYLMILSSRRYSLSYASPLRDNSTRSPNCAMALLPQRKITPYLMTTKENHFILDNRKETSHRIWFNAFGTCTPLAPYKRDARISSISVVSLHAHAWRGAPAVGSIWFRHTKKDIWCHYDLNAVTGMVVCGIRERLVYRYHSCLQGGASHAQRQCLLTRWRCKTDM